MSTFSNLTAKLNLNYSGFSKGLNTATKSLARFAANMKGQINTGVTQPTKKAGIEFKSVARIVQGIIVSKMFYGTLTAIRNSTNAVWEFSKELEYAKIAYTNLFGDSALATEFINVLKDFAATTPFSFQDAEASAKRLLAYGVEYKNVMYMMQGVLAASSMQNNPQTVLSVTRALGQIHTKGRLMNEEMRQLAEAGIPAYEILAEKLGLTDEQLRKLGKTAIPASTAINALIDGMKERFGGVMEASAHTIAGLISNIKDNTLMLLTGVFEPLTYRIKESLIAVYEFVSGMRKLYDVGGLGAIFEKLIPPGLQDAIRYLIVNLQNLYNIIKTNLATIFATFGQVLYTVMHVMNGLLPIINVLIGALAAFGKVVANNAGLMRFLTTAILMAGAAWVAYKLRAVSALVVTTVIQLMVKAVVGLIKALVILYRHPIWSLFAMGIALLVGMSGAAGRASEAIRNMFKGLTSIGGADPDKLLLPDQKDRAASLDKFNQRLGETGDSMDKLADKTGKATKAAKGLLSFDEVFKLNQPDEGTSAGAEDMGDWDIPDFGGIGGGLIPEIPDFGDFSSNFVDGLIESLGGKTNVLSAGIGSLIGGAIGLIIGGTTGATIGLAIGALAGWFWPEVAKKFDISDFNLVAMPVATVLGGAIGMIAGGPLGAIVGVGIGLLVTSVIEKISDGISNGDWTPLINAIGAGLGGVLGFVLGGPVGAAIGASVGLFLSNLINLIVKNWDKVKRFFKDSGNGIKQIFYDITYAIGAAAIFIYEVVRDIIVSIGDAFIAVWDGLVKWKEDTDKWWADLFDSIEQSLRDIKDAVVQWFVDMYDKAAKWLRDTGTTISTWFDKLITNIKDWFAKVLDDISTFFADCWKKFTDWLDKIVKGVQTWFSDLGKKFDAGWNNLVATTMKWFADLFAKISKWFTDLVAAIPGWISSMISKIPGWFSSIWSSMWSQLSSITTKVKNWWNNLWDTKKATVNVNANTSTRKISGYAEGHALGGVFDKEHMANFAEGNKTEAIIPLENRSAMQPFVDAVSDGITASLMPIMSAMSGNQSQSLQPLYVGTLVADERGLRELNRRMSVIQMKELSRGDY